MKTVGLTNPLTKGPEIERLQRLLVTRGFLPNNPKVTDGVFGQQTAKAVVEAKQHYGFKKPRAVAGDRILHALQHDKARHKLRAMIRRPKLKRAALKEARIRASIARYAKWGISHEPQIHYEQARPMDIFNLYGLPQRDDCSEFVTKAYKAAGAPDPNGANYNGTGYTGTLVSHMKHIPLHMVRPGDLVVYDDHHVCIVLENNGVDPLLASHGQERGPMYIRQSEEVKYQPKPVYWLTIF